jgi:hypothetical protein
MTDNPITVTIIDVAAQAREMYGDDADLIAGGKLPDHDWRLEVVTPAGASVTLHRGATAADVAAHLAWEATR